MYALLLTKNSFPIIGQVAWILGKMMEGIFFILDKIASLYGGTPNIGVAIIIFTFIVYLLMLPLTYKQQKFSKLSAKMNPEIQAIQAKYKGSKDPDSAQAMTQETNAVYAKYGVSPMGSCGQLLIQFPILLALYRVIYAIPAYVPMVKNEFTGMINALMGIDASGVMTNPETFQKSNEFIQTLSGYAMFRKQFKPEYLNLETMNLDNITSNLITGENAVSNLEATKNTFIDVINRATSLEWQSLVDNFPQFSDIINNTNAALSKYNMFLGVNIGYSPKDTIYSQLGIENIGQLFQRQADFSNASFWIILVSLLIPFLAAFTQWIGVKLAPTQATDNSKNNGEENPMMASMKTMNTVMPLMSAVFCFTLPAGMGIYWIVGAVIRSIQQVVINKYIDKMNIDELIEKNTAKYNEKLKKRGVIGQGISNKATANTKFVNPYSKTAKTEEQKAKDAKNFEKYVKNDKKSSGGSIAAKANLVKDFNERNNK